MKSHALSRLILMIQGEVVVDSGWGSWDCKVSVFNDSYTSFPATGEFLQGWVLLLGSCFNLFMDCCRSLSDTWDWKRSRSGLSQTELHAAIFWSLDATLEYSCALKGKDLFFPLAEYFKKIALLSASSLLPFPIHSPFLLSRARSQTYGFVVIYCVP